MLEIFIFILILLILTIGHVITREFEKLNIIIKRIEEELKNDVKEK